MYEQCSTSIVTDIFNDVYCNIIITICIIYIVCVDGVLTDIYVLILDILPIS